MELSLPIILYRFRFFIVTPRMLTSVYVFMSTFLSLLPQVLQVCICIYVYLSILSISPSTASTGVYVFMCTFLSYLSLLLQVEDRMGRVEAGLVRAVRESLSKSNRGLEKLRRASLGYLDAAVTSVSSSAVASAQATADHLTETMKEVSLVLMRRLSQVCVCVFFFFLSFFLFRVPL